MPTAPVRVHQETHEQTKKMAALVGRSAGELLDEAWEEYMEKHRAEFAAELETAAHLVRNGSRQDLVAFANRNNAEKAKRASARIRSKR